MSKYRFLKKVMPLNDCKLIDLPKIHDPRGNLTFVEGNVHVPLILSASTTFTMFLVEPIAEPTTSATSTNLSSPCLAVSMWYWTMDPNKVVST